MHHDPLNQERAVNLSILNVCQNLVSFSCWGKLSRKLHSWWCLRRLPPKLGQHWLPSHWSFDTILSASDGTGEEREDTWKQCEERMDRATRLTRARTRALVTPSWFPGSWSRIVHHSFLRVRDTEAGCCHVSGLLPYIICYGLLAVSQADSWLLSLEQRQPLVPLTLRHQWRVLAVAAVIVCQWLQRVRLWLTVGGFGLGIWRVRLFGCA